MNIRRKGEFIHAVLLGTLGLLLFSACGGVGVSESDDTIAVEGLSLNKTSTTVLVGGSEQLVATVKPANATNKGLSWSSSSSAVATVSPAGLVTGKSAGAAVVTAKTSDGGFTADCTVSVSAAPVAVTGVSLNKAATTIAPAGTEQLQATISPANATNQNLTWISSDPAVATVGPGGLVSAVTPGAATITVTTVDGGFTANCVVTVGLLGTVEAPTFNPDGGSYAQSETVALQCTTPGATIKFTTDGSDPASSPTAATGSSVFASMGMTIRAYAYKAGYADSPTSTSAAFSITSGIVFVSTSGNDANQGVLHSPKQTIQSAITLADGLFATGEVRVAAGTYSITSDINMAEGISLVGAYSADFSSRSLSANHTVLQDARTSGAATTIVCSAISVSTIVDGFDIVSPSTDGQTVGISCSGLSQVTIRNNTIAAGTSSASNVMGIACSNSSPTCYNNVIYGGSSVAARNICFNLSYSSSPYVYNNTFIAGTGAATHYIFQARLDGGSECYPTLINNVMTDLTSDSGGIVGIYHMDSGSGHYPAAYTTNLFYVSPSTGGNGEYVYYSGASPSNVNATNYGSMAVTTSSSGTQILEYNDAAWRNIVNQNPLFANTAAHDYRLQVSSPSASTGTDLSGIFTADRDGNPRTLPWSMGAYERD